MNFQSVSYPDHHASGQILRFPPPMVSQALDPARFEFSWKMLQYCFDFPDPASTIAVDGDPSESDHLVLARFVTKARSLAASPFLAYPTAMTVRISNDTDGSTEQVDRRAHV